MNEMLRTVLNGVMHNIRRIISRQDNVDKTLENLGSSVERLDESKGLKTLRVKVADSNYDGIYESSHTGEEIMEYFLAGGDVQVVYNGNVYTNVSIDDHHSDGPYCTFRSTSPLHRLTSPCCYDEIMIRGDGAVTRRFVSSVPIQANVGQISRVSKVDDSGRPIEWEAMDLPKGTMLVSTTFDWGTMAYTADRSGGDICQHIANGGIAVLNVAGEVLASGAGLCYYAYASTDRGGTCNPSEGNVAVFRKMMINNGNNKAVMDEFRINDDLSVKYNTYETSTPFEGLNAESGYVLVADGIRGSANGNIPYSWKYVPMPQPVTVDSSLSEYSTNAVQNSVVTKALADKAKKPLIINADDAPTTGSNSVSGIPIFTIDYTPGDLKAYADAGGSVTVVRYNRHYAMYDATEETAKFRFIEATDMQVDWYHAVLDADRKFTITKTTHKSQMETTTGGAVGQIPIIKSLDSKGRPASFEFGDIPKAVPACSASDDGKFLRVVNGKPAWETIPNVAEVGM